MRSLKQEFSQLLKIAVIGLVVGLGMNAVFAWTGPLSNPPTCLAGNPGCDVPVNVGTVSQLKSGPLSLVTLFVNSLTIPTGSPSAGKVLTAVDSSGLASWQAPVTAGVQPPGSWCGFGASTVTSYLGPTVLCQGSNPVSGCPSSYTRVTIFFYSYGENAWTCVKN